ncbi:GNAT family N-acetyltransferase [Spirosoma sp. HMF3257]|uniref:GNAT family N-acetyltransferase n=1 Tax=Spirosoma telluris TaxID=2183553 RepID=A0A327NFC2_9BACT|nr:GNAT family N-acetyltransferase [Spirosoma telluris]RAI73857.1 GNAT family N-acetyltransferase [Spirosoma telluris]
MLDIRNATQADYESIWEIIQQVISSGDTYVFAPDSSRERMLAYWCGQDKYTYVAELNGKLVGTFMIKDNQPDLGSHIANAGFMTDPTATGQGVGTAMGTFSLEEAKRLGYTAMQFNIVIKSNDRAVRLWQKLGFTIIGEIPDAFTHKQNGLTNAYIMYRKL